MEALHRQAPAKINWGLDIISRQEDGYHQLRSLMQTVDLADDIYVSRAAFDDCACPGLPREENLAFRAWLLLKREYKLDACLRIRIEKRIPPAAGLAGGSSDAAAVLLAADSLLGLGLSPDELCALGAQLGADIPFCLHGGLALAAGIGERITPLKPGRSLILLLVNPGLPLNTAQVYAAYDKLGASRRPDIPALIDAVIAGDIPAIGESAGNALEDAAISLCPQLAALKNAIGQTGLKPLMSGSGPTLFAVAESRAQAEAAALSLHDQAPWLYIAKTGSSI